MPGNGVWPRRLRTGLCWFVAIECLLFAPLKFLPVGALGYPPYWERFIDWGYPGWFAPLVGTAELFVGVTLLLPRRRFLGAVTFVVIMIGAAVTHIINRDTFVESFSAPLHLVLAGIIALTHWPADWREPLAFGPARRANTRQVA